MTILLAVMGTFLMAWVIFCAIQIYRSSKTAFTESDVAIHAKCESCGGLYDVTAKEFNSSYVSKYKYISRTKMSGIAAVHKPQFTYYAKKLPCPYCKKKKYAQIVNINEIQDLSISSMLRGGAKWMAAMVAGGLLLLAAMGASTKILSWRNQQKAEDIKQERYEELRNSYNFGDHSDK